MQQSFASPPADVRAPGIFVLVMIATIQPIAVNMYMPAIADMQADLATSAAAIQLTLSLFLAATAVGQMVVGPISDVLGRRPVLLAGMATFVAGSLLCAVAPSVEVLILGRVIQAVGGCTGLILARAIVRDIYGSQRSASMIGYLTMGLAVAPLITPAIGGLIHEARGWRPIFDVMAVTGAAVLALAWWRLSETHRPVPGTTSFASWWRDARELVRVPLFWVFSGTLGLLSTSFFAFIAGGAFIADQVYDLRPAGYGLYFILTAVGYIVGNYCTGRYSERIGIARMIRLGNVTSLGGVLLLAGLAIADVMHPLAMFLPMLLVGMGNGFALPNAVAGAVSVRPHLAGTASGIAGAFQIGAGAVAALVVGVLLDLGIWHGTVWPMAAPMVVGAVSAVVLGLFATDRGLR